MINRTLLVLVCLLLPVSAHAAKVTLHEAEVDAIFAQEGFGENAIDIRYGESQVLADADFLEVFFAFGGGPGSAATTFDRLVERSLGQDSSVIYIYFVDRLEVEFGSGSGRTDLAGLAVQNTIVVRSEDEDAAEPNPQGGADGIQGARLLAHEIGHVLGLRHCNEVDFATLCPDAFSPDRPQNLMDATTGNPFIPYSTALGQTQIDFLFSPNNIPVNRFGFIKNDGDGNYVEVVPVLVTAPVVDSDGDGVEDGADNCPATANADQVNFDGDALGDACDICPSDPENDADGDGVCAEVDNCPAVNNPGQVDTDRDGFGDACNNSFDDDGDEWANSVDNCPANANTSQLNSDGDSLGDACDVCPLDADNDVDGDGFCADADNCPLIANPSQSDIDNDELGDACDNDADGDSVNDDVDNCPLIANADQADFDLDGEGDLCDADNDNDKVIDAADQCIGTAIGAAVNSEGCSVAQLCPADASWKNHGTYVRCVVQTSRGFVREGLLSKRERRAAIAAAASSDAGKKQKQNKAGDKDKKK